MNHHLESRKQDSGNLLYFLSEVMTQSQTNYNVMKENEQKVEHLVASLIKCMQQATLSFKLQLQSLQELYITYKCAVMENDLRPETVKLADELKEDMEKLKQKLVTETKQSVGKHCRTILQAMETQLTSDYNVMKENEQKVEHLFASLIKCMQQATLSFKLQLQSLLEFYIKYKCAVMENDLRAKIVKLADELEEDMEKLRQKLVTETKQSVEKHCRTILQAIIETQLKSDNNVMNENKQKVEHLVASLLKCMQQATLSYRLQLQSLQELYITDKKGCAVMENDLRAKTVKLADELKEDMEKLKQKLVTEIKQSVG